MTCLYLRVNVCVNIFKTFPMKIVFFDFENSYFESIAQGLCVFENYFLFNPEDISHTKDEYELIRTVTYIDIPVIVFINKPLSDGLLSIIRQINKELIILYLTDNEKNTLPKGIDGYSSLTASFFIQESMFQQAIDIGEHVLCSIHITGFICSNIVCSFSSKKKDILRYFVEYSIGYIPMEIHTSKISCIFPPIFTN